jgi:hypothetical protein
MFKADFRECQCGIAEKDYRLNGGRVLLVFDNIMQLR